MPSHGLSFHCGFFPWPDQLIPCDQVTPRSIDRTKVDPGVKASSHTAYTQPLEATTICGSYWDLPEVDRNCSTQVAPPSVDRRRTMAGILQLPHGFGPV